MALVISEYVEGSSFNKAIELYNGTGALIDLAADGYVLELYSNGNSTANATLSLTGTVADGDVYVLAHPSADPAILAQADATSGSVINWNGDDAIVLRRGTDVVDSFGQVGFDPGSQWSENGVGTQNRTLRRDETVVSGDEDPTNLFDPSAQWNEFAINTFDGLGTHSTGVEPPAERTIVINEIDADTPGTDALEFIELYDGGAGNTSLDGLSLVLYNGSDDASYAAIDLDGQATDENGYFVVGSAAVANVDLASFTTNGLQNGADAVALVEGDASAYPNDTPVSALNVLDVIVYDTNDGDDAALLEGLGQTVQYNEDENGDKDNHALARLPNGEGGFVAQAPTPGETNEGDVIEPPATITLIHDIQGAVGTADGAVVGTDDLSPLAGQLVTVEAIVTADFQDGLFGASGDLNGFFIQEQDAEWDANALTSEGIFIFDGSAPLVDVMVGDLVKVTGSVSEFNGETQISADLVEVVSMDNLLPTSVSVSFPVATVMVDGGDYVANLEAYEGMLVDIAQPMSITEMFELDRFAQYKVSADGRLEQFTQNNDPDAAGFDTHLQSNAKRAIFLDDGQTFQNPDPIKIIDGNDGVLTASDSFRMGDTISNLSGVLAYDFGEFRIHSATGDFTEENPRSATPDDTGGDFKVASLNVLNFFTTLDTFPGNEGVGPNGLDPRGADTGPQNAVEGVGPLDEFDRQTQKIVNAIVAIDADVLGLVELENDFLDPGISPNDTGAQGDRGPAISYLVDQINVALGADVYDYVDPGQEFVGGDAIAVGFLYKKDSVDLLGDTIIVDDNAFLDPNNTGEGKNRAALIQTFEDAQSGEVFTAAINHFKSKGPSGLSGDPATDPDIDQGGGAGFWNDTRTKASEYLANLLATNPTGVADEDILIMGDLNAYARETPVTTLTDQGYVDLAAAELGDDAYSFVFDGQAGTLDYQLASGTLAEKVAGVAEWHINADEADALDYNLEFGRNPALFDGSTPYRASDHDPVIVSFNFDDGGPSFNLVEGTPDADRLVGTDGADLIDAMGSSDVIIAGGGSDFIDAGTGNDWSVSGGSGDDTFFYELGDNALKITDFEHGSDIIKFGEGISFGDLLISENAAYNIVNIYVGSPENRIIVNYDPNNEIDESDFMFDDSTPVPMPLLLGTPDADFLIGNDMAQNIIALEGDDTINAGGGDDRVEAGAGNDWNVRGGEGADQFVFGLGDESIQVLDYEDGIDKIALREGLMFEDLIISDNIPFGLINVFTNEGDRMIIRTDQAGLIAEDDFVADIAIVEVA